MDKPTDLLAVILVGLLTTSSSMVGAAIGLYATLSKRVLASILAFAAGSLISALAIELAFKGAMELHHQGFNAHSAWGFIAGGFACGAIVYFTTSLFLEKKGAAVRLPTQFREYALARKHEQTKGLIGLLAKCDLLRHLPAEAIEQILPSVRKHRVNAGEVVFRAGDPADALYIVALGSVQVVADSPGDAGGVGAVIAELGPGMAFGEMGLISGGARTATIRTATGAELLEIGRADFDALIAADPIMARAVQHLSHERAVRNLSSGASDPSTWARVASRSLEHISRAEANKMLRETGKDAGMAIVLGNILDTIPGCLVIGANFNGVANLSLTLMLGMFLGGIPEGAASAAMLTRAGYKPKVIFALWSTVLVAGMVAAALGKVLIGTSESLAAVFCKAVAGGAVLALVAHTMIPEAIEEGGSLVVLPTVAGFLFAFYLALPEALG
jgi:CRP-like cAMP-binding protein